MNSLITGGAGFIGSHLAELLESRGDNVTIIDNLSTGRIKNIKHLLDSNRVRLVVGSAADRDTMETLISASDNVYHLAAPVGVKWILQHPVRTILDNVRSTDIVLELSNKYRKRVLITSSSEVYGKNLDFIPLEVNGLLSEVDYSVIGSTKNHRWAYANSKILDEFLAFAYAKEYDLPVVIVRLFNCVGPRQTSAYGMVVPTFVRAALQNQPIFVHGDGNQSRTFCYVSDCVEGLITLMEKDEAFQESYNMGGDEEITIKNLATKIVKKTDSDSEIAFLPYEKAYPNGFEDMKRRVPNLAKINKAIGFKPTIGLDEILDRVICYEKEQLGF